MSKFAYQDKLENLINELNEAYLQIVAFVQLLDPKFNPKSTPDAINRIKNQIDFVLQSGSAQALKDLYVSLQANSRGVIWQEELWSYMGENLHNFSLKDLLNKLKSNLNSHPLYLAMLEAQAKIANLKKELNPTENRYLFLRKLYDIENDIKEQHRLLDNALLAQYSSLVIISRLERFDDKFELYLNETIQHIKQSNNIQEYAEFIHFNEIFNDIGNDPDFSNERPHTNSNLEMNQYETKLERLCAVVDSNIKDIEAELIELGAKNSLAAFSNILDGSNIEQRPLHLAIQNGRADIVALLLSCDSKIDENVTENFVKHCSNKEAIMQIQALLHFYGVMQKQSLEEKFAMGRTLGLIRQAMNQLSSYHNLENAVIFMGKTGSGKSTFINYLLGVQYLLEKDNNTNKKYLKNIGSINEKARTSFLSRSETAFPQILNYENINLIDMPGFRDTRGLPWEIAAGLSTQMLKSSFKTLRAVVLICTYQDLDDSRIEGIRDSLEMLGKIINEKPELMKNVLLVISKATDDYLLKAQGTKIIKNRLNEILEENQNSFPSTTNFILKHLNEAQILVADIQSSHFRQIMLNKIKAAEPTQFDHFNFGCYHREAEKFKMLLSRLEAYRRQIDNELNSLQTTISQTQQAALAMERQALIDKPFLSKIELPFIPNDLMAHKEVLDDVLIAQQQLREKVMQTIDSYTSYLSQHFSHNSSSTVISTSDIVEESVQRLARLEIIDSFFASIKPIMKQLGLNFTLYNDTPNSMRCDENGLCHAKDNDLDDAKSFNNNAQQECKGSAWPLPGACAEAVSYSQQQTSSTNKIMPFFL